MMNAAATILAFATACVPDLPLDLLVHRNFTDSGKQQIAFNDTLWWSVSQQRSRLDIDHSDGSQISTVTDPLVSGMAYSARTTSVGVCTCSCFAFSNPLLNHSYIGPGMVNCTRKLPDMTINGTSTQHFVVYADQPTLVRIDYYANQPASGPFPVQVITPLGTQKFGRCVALRLSPSHLTIFDPQRCCKNMTEGRCIVPEENAAKLRDEIFGHAAGSVL